MFGIIALEQRQVAGHLTAMDIGFLVADVTNAYVRDTDLASQTLESPA